MARRAANVGSATRAGAAGQEIEEDDDVVDTVEEVCASYLNSLLLDMPLCHFAFSLFPLLEVLVFWK